MAVSVVKGQKVDITKTNPGLQHLSAYISWSTLPSIELDSSVFLLGQSGKVKGDEGLVFYGNPTNDYIQYVETNPNERQVKLKLSSVAYETDKLAFTLTIYEAEARRQSFSQVNGAYIRFVNDQTGQELLRYDLEMNFTVETAIVVAEMYRHNGEWKLSAIGAGYSGGLKALCESYGVAVEDAPPTPAPPPVVEQTKTVPVPSAPSTSQLNLSKIELKKKGDTINLEKKSGGLGEILINLNWNQQKKSSLWGGNSRIDLDLACLFALKDGRKGVIQALGDAFGSLQREPYISLDGDDRTGSVKSGENIRINGSKLSEIRRILIFTFIYEGVTRWTEADGIVTIKQNNGPDIIVRLDEHVNDHRMCAIALIENVGDTFRIERVVRYFAGHKELDRAFDWGLRWVAGSK